MFTIANISLVVATVSSTFAPGVSLALAVAMVKAFTVVEGGAMSFSFAGTEAVVKTMVMVFFAGAESVLKAVTENFTVTF